MIKLGVAPRLLDFTRDAFGTIDSWFNQVTVRLGINQKAGTTTVAEVPTNQWGIFKNTTTGNIQLIVNDNGTLKSTSLVTNGDAFGVYLPTNQVIPNNTFTKVQMGTEEFDTGGVYDTTLFRFTPTVAGYYQINFAAQFLALAVAAGLCVVSIFKNGSSFKAGTVFLDATMNIAGTTSALIAMNGTTDYLEAYVYQNSGGNQTLLGAANSTYFSGALIRAI